MFLIHSHNFYYNKCNHKYSLINEACQQHNELFSKIFPAEEKTYLVLVEFLSLVQFDLTEQAMTTQPKQDLFFCLIFHHF